MMCATIILANDDSPKHPMFGKFEKSFDSCLSCVQHLSPHKSTMVLFQRLVRDIWRSRNTSKKEIMPDENGMGFGGENSDDKWKEKEDGNDAGKAQGDMDGRGKGEDTNQAATNSGESSLGGSLEQHQNEITDPTDDDPGNDDPRFPPFSGNSCTSRRSQSPTYNHKSPEWYWKLSPALPELWLRDCHKLNTEIVEELEKAWNHYQTLNVPGTGDGFGPSARNLKERKRLKAEYAKLSPNVKKAKEVALARYDWFAIVVKEEWTLDYHVDFAEGKGKLQATRKGGNGRHSVCTVM